MSSARDPARCRAYRTPGRQQQRFVTQQRGGSEQQAGRPRATRAGDAQCDGDCRRTAPQGERRLARVQSVEPCGRRKQEQPGCCRAPGPVAECRRGRASDGDAQRRQRDDGPRADRLGKPAEHGVERREDRLPVPGAEKDERRREREEALVRIDVAARIRQRHRSQAAPRQLGGLHGLHGGVDGVEGAALDDQRRERRQNDERSQPHQQRRACPSGQRGVPRCRSRRRR